MKNIIIYAFSHDESLMEWLLFLVENEDAKIHICSSEEELEVLYKNGRPDILLIDEPDPQEEKHSILELIDIFVPQKKRGGSMVVILSSQASAIEFRVDLLLKGADYIIKKPVNMIELLARINAMARHQKYIQESIYDYVVQTKDIATFDAMDKIMGYLSDHIRPHIEEQISLRKKFDNNEITKEYITKVASDSLEILAMINALRDEIHSLISSRGDTKTKEYDHLEQLFKKNFDLIHLAYDGYIQGKSKARDK